ncbi:hypothetical protein KIPB_008571, partial [Kipferlia bialata]
KKYICCSLKEFAGAVGTSCTCSVSFTKTKKGYRLGAFKIGGQDHTCHSEECVRAQGPLHLRSCGVASTSGERDLMPLVYLGDSEVMCVGRKEDPLSILSMPSRQALEEREGHRTCRNEFDWMTPHGASRRLASAVCGTSLYTLSHCSGSFQCQLLEFRLDERTWHQHPPPSTSLEPISWGTHLIPCTVLFDDILFLVRQRNGIPYYNLHCYSTISNQWGRMGIPRVVGEVREMQVAVVKGSLYAFMTWAPHWCRAGPAAGCSDVVYCLGGDGTWVPISKHPSPRDIGMRLDYHSRLCVFGQWVVLFRPSPPRSKRAFLPCRVYDTVSCTWTVWNVSDFGEGHLPMPDGVSYLFSRDVSKSQGGMGVGEVDTELLYPDPSLKWAEV